MADLDTIIALASGNPPAGISIIRVSGSRSFELAQLLTNKVLPSHKLVLCTIVEPKTNIIIDQGLVVFFPAGKSFTGEDVVEFHLHGSNAIIKKFFSCVLAFSSVRLAYPGEFTRRAFESGQLDLTQVEGLSDLICADTEGQRVQALTRMQGGVSDFIEQWRISLISVLAQIEAMLDFSDESDVSSFDDIGCVAILDKLLVEVNASINQIESGRILREGIRVGIGGLPNVGKSSLVNALSHSKTAIATSEAGTTRDILEVPVDLKGQLVIFIDSAGIRHSSSIAETEGVRRAHNMLEVCDLILWVSSVDVPNSEIIPDYSPPLLHICNKADLSIGQNCDISISCVAGNINPLVELIIEHIDQLAPYDSSVLFSRERDKQALQACAHSISSGLDILGYSSNFDFFELLAEEIRISVYSLERLLGRIDPEDVLDNIFSSFCIGK